MLPLETPGHSWTLSGHTSLCQSLVGSLLLSPVSWCTQDFVCALQESVSPVLCKFWWLYGGVNGYLLQEGLCLRLCDQVAAPRASAPAAGQETAWRAQTKPYVHQDPEEGSSDPKETDPDLPVRVQESLVEAWVSSGLLQGQGH